MAVIRRKRTSVSKFLEYFNDMYNASEPNANLFELLDLLTRAKVCVCVCACLSVCVCARVNLVFIVLTASMSSLTSPACSTPPPFLPARRWLC